MILVALAVQPVRQGNSMVAGHDAEKRGHVSGLGLPSACMWELHFAVL